MSQPRQLRIQGVLLAIGVRLHRGAFYTQDEVLRLVTPEGEVDPGFVLRIVEAACDQQILGRSGMHFIVRRTPDHADYVDICREEGIALPDPATVLEPGVQDLTRAVMNLPNLETQLHQLQQSVEALKHNGVQHHWLALNLQRMPRDTRDALRQKAVQLVGSQATQDEVEKHMVLVAAQVLVHALRPPRKPPVRGIIPVSTGDDPHAP